MVLFRRILGDVLRSERMQRGLTLREVSADARVSLGYISEIERGQKEASSELLASLCSALDLPLSDVLREVSDAVAVEELAQGLRRRRGHPDHLGASGCRRRGRLRRLSRPRRLRVASVLGLAARAPVRRALPLGGPAHRDAHRRAAPAAGRVVASVDPHPLARAQVAGGGLDRPLLVEVEHLAGPAHQPLAGRAPRRPGRSGCTPLVKHSSAVYMLPMPARLVWSSSASPTGRAGSLRSRRRASASSQSPPSRSGPRWPTTSCSWERGISSTMPREKPTAARAAVRSTTRAWVAGSSPLLVERVDVPAALHLEVRVQRPGLVVLDVGQQVLAARERCR